MDTSKVTRFEVIAGQRILVRDGVIVELSLQDNGRTLKVFLKDSPLIKPEDARRHMQKEVTAFITDRMSPGGPYNDPSTPPPMGD